MKQAIEWNLPDIAVTEVFNRQIVKLAITEKNELMRLALLSDNVESFNLLLEKGFLIEEFLTYNQLMNLYTELNVNLKSEIKKL